MSNQRRPRLIDDLVTERAEAMLRAAVSVHIEKAAEAFATEALRDETFKQALHALVKRRSQEILDELLRPQPERRQADRAEA